MAGVMIGSYSFGWLSDRAGRKPAFFIAVVIQVDYKWKPCLSEGMGEGFLYIGEKIKGAQWNPVSWG